MSLFVAADGILETHVTWQDVEAELQTALGTTAKFGPSKKATNIGDMKGFMSRIALINPDWEDPNGNEDITSQNLPEKFVVKISSQLAFAQVSEMFDLSMDKAECMEALTKESHNREVEAYKFLTELANPKIPITKIYALKSFSVENPLKGFIISDHVPNITQMGMHANIDARDLPPFVKALGALSASAQKLSKTDFSFASNFDFIEVLFKEMFDEAQTERIFAKLCSAFPEEYQPKVKKYEEIFSTVYSNPKISKKYKSVSEFLGAKDVLCHCDPWSNNFLTTIEDGRLILKAIIDWQTISICNPALDICRHLIACLSPEERAAKKDEFLEMYYNAMLEELGDHTTPPYTLEQLHHSYHLHLPILALLVLPGVAPFLEHAQNTEGEQQEKVRKMAHEKMIGLLDDVFKSHEYNMKHFPDFFNV